MKTAQNDYPEPIPGSKYQGTLFGCPVWTNPAVQNGKLFIFTGNAFWAVTAFLPEGFVISNTGVELDDAG